MRKSTLLLGVLGLLAARGALAQIPPGFEIVQITGDPNYDGWPKINNCGEIVFSKWMDNDGPVQEIFLYDNGQLTQITNDKVWAVFPDINDAGTIVWRRGAGNQIVRLRDGVLSVLGTGSGPAINNLGHVAWKLFNSSGCASPSAIFFYNGATVEEIIDDGLSNQSVELNDHDELVWTRYDNCVFPWESEIMLYSAGVITALPARQTTPQIPDINNMGQVVWGGNAGLELWEDGVTTLITALGHNPALNDRGDIYFIRWHDDTSTWDAWLYQNDTFYRLSDEPDWDTAGDINDHGEAVWHRGMFPEKDVFLMRRIRDGDVEFDDDVDLDDFAVFQGCLLGPVETDRLCECRFLDLDHDRDVDLRDFSTFQNVFTAQE